MTTSDHSAGERASSGRARSAAAPKTPRRTMQPAAFTPRPGAFASYASLGALHGMAFPPEWFQLLRSVQAAASGRTPEAVTPPVRSLNEVLRALIPHVVVAPRQPRDPARSAARDGLWDSHARDLGAQGVPGVPGRQGGGAGAPWLLAGEEISPHLVWAITQAWLEQTYQERAADDEQFRAHLAGARAALLATDLRWDPVTIPALLAPASNGTARAHPLAYSALPALLAERAIARGLKIAVGGNPRALTWAPLPGGGAELMSWPPAVYVDNDQQKHFYSYVITLTLQTVPGAGEPRVHAHYSVRRWRSQPLIGPDGQAYVSGRWSRAFLRPTGGWMGLPRSSACAVAWFGAERVARDGATRSVVWQNAVPAIASRLMVPFPPADAYARDPLFWMGGTAGVELAVIEMWPRMHGVGAGVGSDDVERLTTALAETFANTLELVPQLERLPRQMSVAAHPLQKHLQELPSEQRLAGLRESVLGGAAAQGGADVTIEVWWSTEPMRDWLATRVVALMTEPLPALTERPPAHASTEQSRREAGASGPLAQAAAQRPGQQALFAGVAPEDEEDMEELAELEEELEEDMEALAAPEDLEERAGAAADPDGHLNGAGQPASRRARIRAVPPTPAPVTAPISIDLPGGGGARLVIVPRPLGRLGDPLDPAEKNRSFVDRTQARASQLIATFPPATGPTLALVELPNYQDSSPARREMRRQFRRRDPKTALRLAFAQRGRVTQFVTPPTPADLAADPSDPVDKKRRALVERVNATVLDGLRNLGYLSAPIGFRFEQRGPQLPDDLLVAAIHVVRVTRKRSLTPVEIPVVVAQHTGHQQVFAWLPDGKPLRPYRQALLDLATLAPETVRRANRDKQFERLQAFLRLDLPNQGARNTVILVAAQNARQLWTGVTNDALAFDAICYEREKTPIPTAGMRGKTRLVRLRTNEREETPEWYLPGTRPDSSAAGVWHDPALPRVFYSTADKPRAMKGHRRGKQGRPQEQYAIPTLLEIVPAAVQPEDLDETGAAPIWAYAVEQWRRMGYLAPEREMTLLPLPLRFAERMTEYAQVITTLAFPEDSEGGDDEDVDDENMEADSPIFKLIQSTLF